MLPTLGAPQIFPAEVAANRRRAITLCALAAVLPALLLGALVGVTLSYHRRRSRCSSSPAAP